MIYDFVFYCISAVCLVSLVYFFRYKRRIYNSKILTKISAYLIILCCSAMLGWNALLVIVPKGTQLYESIRLPRHFWMLNNKIAQYDHDEIQYGKHPKQYCQFFFPGDSIKNKETIVYFIHGGGWCLGSPKQHHYLANLLTKQGYTVVLTAYRLTPDFSFNDLNQDINLSFKHSLKYLNNLGLDSFNVVIGGVSAGANLAALFAFDENRWANLNRKRLKGVFCLAGVLDLDLMPHTSTLNDYTGPRNAASFQKANPVNYINEADSFPFLCIHGNKDGLAKLDNALSFFNKKKKIDTNNAFLFVIDEGTHLDLGAGWYYHSASEKGQKDILLNWLKRL